MINRTRISNELYSLIVGQTNHLPPFPININAENQRIAVEKLSKLIPHSEFRFHLGAGVSVQSGAPNWTQLLFRTISSTLKHQHSKIRINSSLPGPIERDLRIVEILDKNRIQFLYLLQKNLYKSIEYSKRNYSMDFVMNMIECIQKYTDLCVISYNYDDILERRFKRLRASRCNVRSVYSKRSYAKFKQFNGIKIYHPHGYIPRNMSIDMIFDQKIAFTEREYNKIYSNTSDNWRMKIHCLYPSSKQQSIIRLFFGFSFSDSRIRSLLDYDEVKENPKISTFALMRASGNEIRKNSLSHRNSLIHIDLLSLGVYPIWWARNKDLNQILNDIRENIIFT